MTLTWVDAEGRTRRKRVGIPDELADATLDNLLPRDDVPGWQEGVDTVYRYAAGLQANVASGRGLLLVGSVGLGKSHIAAAVLKETMVSLAARSGYWIRVSRLLAAMMPGVDRDAAASVKERVRTTECLVLDELGGEHGSDFGLGVIEDLLSVRHDKKLVTIVTANLAPADICERYGERYWDRLQERNDVIVLVGPSYRGRQDSIRR